MALKNFGEPQRQILIYHTLRVILNLVLIHSFRGQQTEKLYIESIYISAERFQWRYQIDQWSRNEKTS